MTDEDHWESVAAAWAKWWPIIETGARPVSETLVELAALRPGERVLDLASGIGEPAATAARRVGPEGRVVATDLAPTMVALGRERVAGLGLGNVEFRQMDAAAPDLPAAGFDAVLCRWGLMFVPDVAATLAAWRALLVPGGRLAVAVWGAPEAVPSISLATRVLRAELDLPPPPEGDPTPFDLADIGAFEATLTAAGFSALRSRPVKVVFDYASADDFIAFRREVSPTDKTLEQVPEARRDAAWRRVAEALAPYRTADGRIVMENLSVVVAGVRT
jgi:SAM-dependent methyltransferase